MAKDSGLAWIGGVLVGATAVFLLNPLSGRRQSAAERRPSAEESPPGDAGMDSAGRPAAPPSRLFLPDLVEDHRLETQVRAALARLTTRPQPITVEVRNGHVRLRGSVPEAELGDVLTGLRRVPGVVRLESLLEPAGRPRQEAPSVTGSLAPPPEVPAEPLSPPARVMVGTAGGLLALWGIRHGGASGVAGAALGGWMIARSVVDETVHPWIAEGGPPTTVGATIEVQAPIQKVFAAWTHFSSFPSFMKHLREVRESENGISYWVADGPAGMPVSWSAEILSLQPFERVAWRSVEGSMIRNAGEVRFEDVAEECTRIHVRMVYQPPAGQLGRAVAACFGADPARQLNEDLRRFQALLEAEAAEALPAVSGVAR